MLQVRSAQHVLGYHGRERLADGWKSVGDIAHLDVDGYVYIRDRPGDLVITGGMNVYPAEVEAVLHEHPDVLDVAVYGLPSAEWGETVHAVVVPRDGRALDVGALEVHVAERLADYKRPRSWQVRAALPRTESGKLLKRLLRAEHGVPGKGIPRSGPGVRSGAVTVRRLTRRGFLAAVPAAAVCGAAACGVAAVPGARPAPSAHAVPGGSPSPPPRRPRRPTQAGPHASSSTPRSGRPEVALTFHGAGDLGLARTDPHHAADRGAAVTVLAVGTWLQQYPDAARLVTDLGHELGNHTWCAPDAHGARRAPAVRAEIERCRDRIAALTGGPGAFFRPSAAQHATPEVLRLAGAAGLPDRAVLRRRLPGLHRPRCRGDPRAPSAAATAGAVVSLHLGHPGTLDALPGLLDDLAARGLDPVTASALFR